jgi:hypothetical protein
MFFLARSNQTLFIELEGKECQKRGLLPPARVSGHLSLIQRFKGKYFFSYTDFCWKTSALSALVCFFMTQRAKDTPAKAAGSI